MNTIRPEWTADAVRALHLYAINLKDVAEEMGVTKSYISLVMNGGNVSDTQKQKILETIDFLINQKIAKEKSIKTDFEKRSKKWSHG